MSIDAAADGGTAGSHTPIVAAGLVGSAEARHKHRGERFGEVRCEPFVARKPFEQGPGSLSMGDHWEHERAARAHYPDEVAIHRQQAIAVLFDNHEVVRAVQARYYRCGCRCNDLDPVGEAMVAGCGLDARYGIERRFDRIESAGEAECRCDAERAVAVPGAEFEDVCRARGMDKGSEEAAIDGQVAGVTEVNEPVGAAEVEARGQLGGGHGRIVGRGRLR